MNNANINGEEELIRISSIFNPHTPISFVRFSDGEIDILRNQKAIILNNKTFARGHEYKNDFPIYDSKTFIPEIHYLVREDLLKSAMFRAKRFFKGIPTAHNNSIGDREFMLRLHGGYNKQITFSDLFTNSNFLNFRNFIFPNLLSKFKKINVVCNYRSKLSGLLASANQINIPDNFFKNYSSIIKKLEQEILNLPKKSLVLFSASSITNIIAYKVYFQRSDLTIIDVGTAVNDLLKLDVNTREYHILLNNSDIKQKQKYKNSTNYKLRW